ncbi:unnamed protein product [Polarella glacialis]|uniref:Aminotransferase class I/classII large domain-containing protein n=2 Tax=Polarella glacialis TaxID=89957 RepID=A0A813GUS4_POLGL|nr:unnamed protein product [Polarella glacialis]
MTAAVSDYHSWFSRRALSMPPSPFGQLVPLMRDPEMKVLCQGVPPDSCFPLLSMTCKLLDGSEVVLSEADTRLAQRYPPFACGPLREWLLRHVLQLHSPPLAEWDITIAAGSMSSVDLVCAMLVDPGDVVLIEEYSFLAGIDALRSYGAQLHPLPLDAEGLRPDALERACTELAQRGLRPKMLYTVPVGQNPTGTSMTSQRYAQIYDIARRFNILIVEDDAYFYQQHVQRGAGCSDSSTSAAGIPATSREEMPLPGMSLGPSFLSLDSDGRVLRLDSFSKTLAPGFRLGWATGAKPLIDRYNMLAYASSQNGCSLSMMLLGKMLEAWGDAGFEAHLRKLQSALRSRCDALVAAAEAHLGPAALGPGAAASWQRPQAGMFLWCRLANRQKTTEELVALMRQHGVAVMPGEFCSAAGSEDGKQCPYLRLSFVASEGEYPEAMRRLGGLMQSLGGET